MGFFFKKLVVFKPDYKLKNYKHLSCPPLTVIIKFIKYVKKIKPLFYLIFCKLICLFRLVNIWVM